MAGRIISGVKPLKLVMVGGVAGGATAAARARRVSELSQILMFEKGRDISVASCGLPYHVSGEIADRGRLVMSTPQHLRETLAVDVRTQHEVLNINRKEKTIDVCNLGLPQGSAGSIFQVPYDKLLLGTGAVPIVPPIPGLAEGTKSGRIFTLRSLEDMDSIIKRIKSNCQQNKQVVVIGAGLVGLEMVEALSRLGLAVTIVEDRDHVAPLFDKEISAPMADEMTANGVRVMASSRVVAFHDQPASNTVTVELKSGEVLEASMVVQNIGVRPESTLAVKAGLAVDKRAAIIVNPFMQTSDNDIYAVGDVASTPFCPVGKPSWLPLGGPANRMARIAADHMLLGDSLTDPYRGSFGTCIVRVFDSVAGKTGLTEFDCTQAGIPYQTSTITGPSHASYYPGSTPVCLKVLYDPDTGKLLGAQSIGGNDGVDKRLDVIATALAGGLTVNDLAHLDLAYAPPFGAARDVINTAGFAGNNMRTGMMNSVSSLHEASALASSQNKNLLVLDVRDSMSSTVRPVPSVEDGGVDPSHVVNIPLEEVRGRIEEIKALIGEHTRVVTVCNLGKLSYFASRILSAHDIPCQSLAGGLSMLKGRPSHSLSHAEARPPKTHNTATSSPAAGSTVTASALSRPESSTTSMEVVQLDVCGIACPGPIMAIRKALPSLSPGQQVCVTASDPGFYNDFSSFCRVNGLEVLSVEKGGGKVKGQFRVPGGHVTASEAHVAAEVSPSASSTTSQSTSPVSAGASNVDMALVVFSGEMDKVMAAFVLANGTLAMGGKVTMFFTFWGLNALKCSGAECPYQSTGTHLNHASKTVMDRMLSVMLPKGLDALPLSNLQMGGAGPIAMKMQMKQKHLPNLPDLLREAQQNGARFVACAMSMEALGVGEDELIRGVELGGVADFLEEASKAKTTLFI